MPEKRQAPLWLDMDFAEALARFGQTSGVEAKEAETATATKKRATLDGSPAELTVTKPPVKRGRKKRSS